MKEGQSENSREWSGKTDGIPWMIRTLVRMMKIVDRRVIYCIMALVVPFYMLINRKGYKAAYSFLRRRMQFGPLKSFVGVYRNHLCFGKVIIDRYAAYAGKKFRFINFEPDLFAELMTHDEGFVQLSTHAGNFEMAGYTLTSTKQVNSLVYGGESAVMMNFRKRILESHNIRVIATDGTMTPLFEMNAALVRGEIVSMTGDRLVNSNKGVECSFFGEKAMFPAGPFSLAAQKEVPLLAVFVMRENNGAYRIFEHILEADTQLPVRQRISVLAQQYASVLETVVRQYPYQWFNYYDFWAKN